MRVVINCLSKNPKASREVLHKAKNNWCEILLFFVVVVTVEFSFEDSQTKKAVVLKEFYLYGTSVFLSTAPPL